MLHNEPVEVVQASAQDASWASIRDRPRRRPSVFWEDSEHTGGINYDVDYVAWECLQEELKTMAEPAATTTRAWINSR